MCAPLNPEIGTNFLRYSYITYNEFPDKYFNFSKIRLFIGATNEGHVQLWAFGTAKCNGQAEVCGMVGKRTSSHVHQSKKIWDRVTTAEIIADRKHREELFVWLSRMK